MTYSEKKKKNTDFVYLPKQTKTKQNKTKSNNKATTSKTNKKHTNKTNQTKNNKQTIKRKKKTPFLKFTWLVSI